MIEVAAFIKIFEAEFKDEISGQEVYLKPL